MVWVKGDETDESVARFVGICWRGKIFCEFVCVYNILTAIGFFSLQFTVLFVFSFAFQCVCFADERYINIYDFCSFFLFHSNAV